MEGLKLRVAASWIAALACAAVALAVWLAPLPSTPGLTWDEAYYYPTFLDVRSWCGELVTAPAQALSREQIDRGWNRIHELPPLVKFLGALAISPEPSGRGTLFWMRAFPAAAFGLTLFLLWSIAARMTRAPAMAALAPLLYAMHPILYGHAQIAASETVFCALTAAALWAALHDLSRWRWRITLAALAGLALAAKVNGVLLIGAVGAWTLLKQTLAAGRPRPPMPRDLVALGVMLVGAPIVAWLMWPWLWHDTFARVVEYVRFVQEHSHLPTWFLGRKTNIMSDQGTILAPWYYPASMTLVSAPITWLLCTFVGTTSALFRVARASRPCRSDALSSIDSTRPEPGQHGREAHATLKNHSRIRVPPGASLLCLAAMIPFLVSSLPNVPRYDGTRLFLPFFAPLVVLATVGLTILVRRFSGRARRFAVIVATLAVVAEFLTAVTVPGIHPLSYYNAIARRAGVSDGLFAFELTYWGDALDADVLDGLNERLPPLASVKTLALQDDIFPILQRWDMLRGDIKFNGAPPYAAHLMQNRKGFWGGTEWWFARNREPIASWHTFAPTGEPMVYLFGGEPPGR